MSRYYDDDEFDDDLDVRRRDVVGGDMHGLREPRLHSGPGIVSLGLAIIATLGGGAAAVMAGVLAAMDPPVQDDDPLVILTVLLFAASLLVSFTGLIVGFVGSLQSDRNPTYAVAGLGINAMVLFGLIVLICLGVLGEL